MGRHRLCCSHERRGFRLRNSDSTSLSPTMTIHLLSLTQYSEYVSSGFKTLSLEHHLFEYVGEPSRREKPVLHSLYILHNMIVVAPRNLP
ncbi:hypothetical protein [Desulfurococcus amylolyticus]|uniref:hypothetical protein n=1 Tax=Desulfurococcus amylolyticus TaxID=94694 RepID=UPI0012ECB906|nr:hypothetical protein [Desulfurococcus amylolyticus]